MKRLCLTYFISLNLVGVFSHASARECLEIYGPLKLKTRTKLYWSEVKQNPLRRPFLIKETNADVSPNEKLRGLLTPSDALGFSIIRPLVQAVPRYLSRTAYGQKFDVTPMHFLYKNIVHPSIVYTTQQLSGRAYQPTKLSKLLGAAVLSITAFIFYDHYTTRQINQHSTEMLMQNQPEYQKTLQTDYRFHEVLVEKEKTNLKPEEVVGLMAHMRFLQISYFKYMAEKYQAEHVENPHEANLNALKNKTWGVLHFRDIANLYEKGVPTSSPSFLYAPNFKPKLEQQQLDRLMRNRHFALHKYEYIRALFEKAKNKDEILSDPDIKFYFDSPESMALLEKMLSSWTRPNQDVTNIIQKLNVLTHWEERFANYEALGLILLEPTKMGSRIVEKNRMYSQIVDQDGFAQSFFKVN